MKQLILLFSLWVSTLFSQVPEPFELNELWGYRQGDEVIHQANLLKASKFHKKLTVIQVESGWNLMDGQGQYLLSKPAEKISSLKGDVGLFLIQGKVGAFNAESGKLIFDAVYDSIKVVSPELYFVQKNKLWYASNSNGDYLSSGAFEKIKGLGGGLYAVESQRGWGIINTKGIIVLESSLDSLEKVSVGMIRFSVKGKFGFLNHKGDLEILPKYDKASDFTIEGTAMVSDEDNIYRIDKQGKVLRQYKHNKADSAELALESLFKETGQVSRQPVQVHINGTEVEDALQNSRNSHYYNYGYRSYFYRPSHPYYPGHHRPHKPYYRPHWWSNCGIPTLTIKF